MKLKAFSLLETIVALSILAFVTAASIYHVGNLYARAQLDMGKIYVAMKALENVTPLQEKLVDHGAFRVESTITEYSEQLDQLTILATHKSGRPILITKKLVRNAK